MLPQHNPEEILDQALDALSTDADWRTTLDALPAPIYVTDAEGAVIYWNEACVQIAGRVPKLGDDRWRDVEDLHDHRRPAAPRPMSHGARHS